MPGTSFTRRKLGAVLAIGARAGRLMGAPGSRTAPIDECLRAGIANRKIPAAAARVASGRGILYAGAFGERDSSGVPVTNDSIFSIASMTKAITTVAALQLVEQGKVKLEGPAAEYLPQLAHLEVLDGFDPQSGKPILRPAKTQVTLKHLLTHTSGFCYDMWDGRMLQYAKSTSAPAASGAAAPVTPLMFEPGTGWQYGTGIDWTGRLVEGVSGMSLEDYFQTRILRPLEMADTSYILAAGKFDRLVSSWHREAGGALKQDDRKPPAPPKSYNGGGGLYSTTADYVRFMQMILGEGRGVSGARILEAATVRSMEVNQIGALTAGKMKSYRPETTSDVDIQPGFTEKWGLGFLINTTAYQKGRSAGSLAWAGLFNTFYWIDPRRSLCAVLMMQFLPFVDKEAVGLLGDFERAVYGAGFA
jgi:methyl acetate hydrolase